MEYWLVAEVVYEATAGSSAHSKTDDPSNTAGLKSIIAARNWPQRVQRIVYINPHPSSSLQCVSFKEPLIKPALFAH
jgi:hypothetical protein